MPGTVAGAAGTLLVHGPRGSGKAAFVDDLLALSLCTDADPARRPSAMPAVAVAMPGRASTRTC